MIEFLTTLFQSIGKEVIIGLITAAVLAGWALGKKYFKDKKAKKLAAEQERLLEHKKEVMEGLNSYVVTTEDLRDLCAQTGAIRSIVIQLHNGGHKPELGNQLKATIVAEWSNENFKLISPDWQGAYVDADYIISVVKPLINQGNFYLHTDDMRSSSTLKDYYISNDIIGAKIVMLGICDKTESTFLLASHFIEEPEIDETFRSLYRSKGNKIASKLDLV